MAVVLLVCLEVFLVIDDDVLPGYAAFYVGFAQLLACFASVLLDKKLDACG